MAKKTHISKKSSSKTKKDIVEEDSQSNLLNEKDVNKLANEIDNEIKNEVDDEIDKDEKISRFGIFIILGAIAVFILIVLVIPFFFKSEPNFENKYTYNGFEFIENGGIWFSKTKEGNNMLQTSLRHGPLELEDIPVQGDIIQFKQTYQFIYITFDPRENYHDSFVTMSNAEISPNMVVHFGKDISAACLVSDPICTDSEIPVITCNNVDSTKAVIFINRVNDTKVVVEDNCVIISGMGEELVMAADRFLYGMYGIMK